jgi:phosphomannomutase
MAKYPSSGEINRQVPDTAAAIGAIKSAYSGDAIGVDTTDGVSIEFADWRFNLRGSNTEPVIRLNVESRGDEALMREKTKEILARLEALG